MMGCSEDARLWLEISLAKGVGPEKWVNLASGMPPVEIARMLKSEEGRERLSRRLGRAVGAPDPTLVEAQLKLLDERWCCLISLSDESYPRLLREIFDPPLVFYCRGDVAALSRPSICIVGSRHATRRGLITAQTLARELSEHGIHVVSGLARGIDSAAHRGALEGPGGTSAVFGCGVDTIYPPEHAGLAKEIATEGCIVSEFALGTPPLKHHFPQRNRILSGLSLGVIVVEAGLDSGAMGTARWAIEQNREVFAVPGPIDSPGSAGPHKLIREGATLVEGIDDILAELPSLAEGERRKPSHKSTESFTDEERIVLSALDLNPKHIDELVQFCHISPTVMLPLLLGLEMRGMVESCGGGTYALVPRRRWD
jgi:DNA processing protein